MKSRNPELDRFEQEYFDSMIKLSPLTASYLGLHEYDDFLDRVNEAHLRKAIALELDFLDKFMSFKESDLSHDQLITRKLFAYQTDLSRFRFDCIRRWESDADAARFIGYAVFPLFTGQYAPLEQRIRSIIKRLAQTGQLIKDFKNCLKRPVKLWLTMAQQSISGTESFFESMKAATSGNISSKLWKEFDGALTEALNELKNYSEYLDSLMPGASERFDIGDEAFRQLIKLRHMGLSVEEIKEIGNTSLKQVTERMEHLARKLGAGTIEEARKLINGNNPGGFNSVLDFYRTAIDESREFVKSSGFAAIPLGGENIRVIETPQYMRHMIPFAAYIHPARFEDNPSGTYLVTPPKDEADLKKFNSFDIINTSIHEGFPGHHLQLASAITHPSPVRLITGSAIEFIEGWALYCEEQTFNMGFHNEQEREFVMLNDILFRAARVIIDVELSSGRMTFNYAMKMLSDNTGMGENEARAEVNRYTENPGYQLSYLIGKHQLLNLRKKWEKSPGFTLSMFHNTLLANGSLPIFLHDEC
ncbi:MAG: DUF885 domain-containing protein, partial [Candidatus Wallbacteria bacterium]|nr:DUF885 domain-containing protein [Candidatus Wallbacteria bacterium]